MPRQKGTSTRQAMEIPDSSTLWDQAIDKLIDNVYGDLSGHWSGTMGRTFEHLSDRAIFLQSAATMLLINQRISNLIGGEPHTSQTEDVFYTPGCILNEFSGVTPGLLEWVPVCDMGLKTGMPVILTEHNFLKVGTLNSHSFSV
ncbi:hypothetical protein PSHT_10686 [Puccinia striiformis]|uniref:Uncharacterized protein n=1 Tax=Puccinia striiformis TaxID=27350 RepID=A0A2S4V7Y6_9BASI|nr:hypothetical protein PSHT_10686 [Puccinia striiformis]